MDEIIKQLEQEIEDSKSIDSTWSKGLVAGMRHAIRLILEYRKSHPCYCAELTQHPPADGEVLDDVAARN